MGSFARSTTNFTSTADNRDNLMGKRRVGNPLDDLLVEIQVPPMRPNVKGAYLKHSPRGSIDLAVVGVAAIMTVEGKLCRDVKIILGAVAPTPMRAKKAEEVLRGKNIDDALIEQAAQAASEQCCPITDVRASAEYRTEMVVVLTRRVIKEAITR